MQTARDALRSNRDVPFVWDIAFVEIFEGNERGFGIVIGNPPYVRQERIADPLHAHDGSAADRKRYKDKLVRSVYRRYERYFGFNHRTGKATRKLDSKSDLYIYFFFHGLGLLSQYGSFCFVTSNSWLDVGYGADLQEFLLRQSQVRFLIDNKSRRTFANADVNSAIALLGPVQAGTNAGLQNTARFVLFEVPFEDALRPDVWQNIEAVTERTPAQKGVPYRVYPVSQATLLEDGIPASDLPAAADEATPKAGEYAGNKWGGKYLRAPDIFYTLLDKGAENWCA